MKSSSIHTVLFAQMFSRRVQSPQHNSRPQCVLLNTAEQEHRLQMTKVTVEKPCQSLKENVVVIKQYVTGH